MISAISIFLHNIEKALEVKNIPFIIIWSVLVISGIIAPSLIESMYILNYKYILVLVFSFVYMIVMPFCGYLGKRIKL